MKYLGVFLVLLLLLTSAQADDVSYKQDLINRFPFYNVARDLFTPVYPALAQQLVQDYNLHDGIYVDMGGAEGSLAMELAKLTKATVYVADIDPAAVRLCNLLVDEAGLTERVRAVEADAQNLPLRDNFADLVVSRNSLFEWPDKLKGFKEAYRILKPGGVAYMGGGFSRLMKSEDITRLVDWSIKKRDQKPDSFVKMPDELVPQLRSAGVANIRLLKGPTEFDWWIEMRKPKASKPKTVVGITSKPGNPTIRKAAEKGMPTETIMLRPLTKKERVPFSHTTHIDYSCNKCHPKLFGYKAGGLISMMALPHSEGGCAVCHDGKTKSPKGRVIFTAEGSCSKCHPHASTQGAGS
jgi:c(7)-type cytochrome triheme protein